MFKKSNRNFRSKRAEFDSDEEESREKKVTQAVETQVEVAKAATTVKNGSQTTQVLTSKSTIGTKVLTYDEEQDEEVDFKVKKSKESRRIAKEMKKIKKEKEKQTSVSETTTSTGKHYVKLEVENDHDEQDIILGKEIQFKPLKQVSKANVNKKESRYLTNKYKTQESYKSDDEFDDYMQQANSKEESDNESDLPEDNMEQLQRLREEMEILNGDDVDHVEKETDETKRSMKLMLKSGIIPDASIIHAARKKREMARQGDYIPLKNSENSVRHKADKTRFIREDDDNDLSDFEEDAKGGVKEEDSKRMSMNFRHQEHKERQAIRDNFLAYEQGSDDERKSDLESDQRDDDDDEDDEEDRWEKEQLRKVLATQVDLKSMKKEKLLKTYVNYEDSNSNHEQTFDVNKLKNLELVTFDSIKSMIKKNASSLQETYQARVNQNNMTLEKLNAAKSDLENLKISKPITDEQYVYFQEINSYIRDFIDCFNEKIDEIEKAESKWFVLFKQRADKLIARRQDEIRDQTVECSNTLSTSGVKRPIDPAHQRRIHEREARRAKRALKREEKLQKLSSSSDANTKMELNEGFSSDEEDNLTDENIFKQKRDDIVNQLTGNLFTDVIDDFHDYNLIMQRFDKWKKLCPSSYRNAYVALSLPKILSPLVRYDLIDWNPLEIDEVNYLENRKWFACLIAYNRDNIQVDLSVKYLDDLLLIPYIVEKTIVTRLVSIAECIYDPFSSRQTGSFAGIVSKLINDCPTLNSQSSNTKKLIETVYGRFKRAINEDVFIPLYSKQIIEQKTSEPSKFFNRQFWSCVKLYKNVFSWTGIFSDNTIRELAFDCLLNRYLMISFQSMEPNIHTLYNIEYVLDLMPRKWLKNITEASGSTATSVPQLVNMCRLIRRIADAIYENEYKTKKINATKFKEQLRRIKNVFNNIGASDQSLALSNSYDDVSH